MSSAGSDTEKSPASGFYSYITNDYVNVEALNDTHSSSHGFHQGTWLSSVLHTRGLPGCSQGLARVQDHQRLEWEGSLLSPFRLVAEFPSSVLSLAVGQEPLSFSQLAPASCHLTPLTGSLHGSSPLGPGQWEHAFLLSSKTESCITKAKPGSGVCCVK